ncbi:S-DNA-T family DNA segregation ATPase FtsK/SpoIIIE [Nocardiopsis arvandica]|uniref:S-DNA-T family DNA segregation ATPase FtsK/SpoIIIE n=2 Tax=Nocardiopsis sinuspersici TaxID=501010 RepID=A0A7Y9XCX1_9ACTN|nr:S-DNA-T family DNA segregation ATPase FtsK/SpoIIIE [Nocardiopsis sinuspersici]
MPENPPASSSGAMIIMPIITGSGSLLMSITMGHRPLMAVAGVMIMMASVVVGIIMFVSQHNGPRKRIREQRERYVDYLDQLRGIVRDVASTQRADNAFRHPAPELLTDPARSRARRWERRASDPDFLDLRAGTGTRPLARRLKLKVDTSSPLIVYDPVCQGSADQLIELYANVPEMPLVVPLREHGVVSIVGDREAGRGLARALIAQMATFHSPHDLRIGVVRDNRLRPRWEWLKWLPHNTFDEAEDGPLPARFVSVNTVQAAELLSDEIERRTVDLQRRRGAPPGPGTQRLVVVLDGEYQSTLSGLHAEPPVNSLADLGVHVIALVSDKREEPEAVDLRLNIGADGTLTEDTGSPGADEDSPYPPIEGRADRSSVAHLTSLARVLAPYGIAVTDSDDAMHGTVGLPEILGVPDVAQLDTRRTWRKRSTGDYLRVPIGIGPNGNTVLLDLKESAFGGMGPHGLVVGATGSGKSEMLRTMVASLVINHSPENLALLLVDFKGGATFADTDRLPHSAGLITNLADDDGLVTRFREATFGELVRRQQLLKNAGNLPNLHAYEAAREDDPELEPLPHLLIIIDEFSELLTAHPDFAELFVAIGRIGRSIGVHLLLATQRLESGKIKGLESHLSYRVGLRTFSEAESREAIGVGDAYHLPPEPGSGYLKVDTSVFERFKAAMVSQPYEPPRQEEEKDEADPVLPLLSYNGLSKVTGANSLVDSLVDSIRAKEEENRPQRKKRTTLQVTVDRLAESGADPVRPVWLPPLPEMLPFDSVLADLGEADDLRGQGTEPDPAECKAVIGLTDIPREQRVIPAELDFTGGEGNIVVLGGPQSGKSTLLRTAIASLAWRYPPGRVAVYAIDFGGGALQAMDELPHVAGVAGRADPERVQRILTDVSGHLDRRQRAFRKHKLDSPAALRQARAEGKLPDSVVGDLFLMIDGWSAVRDAFDTADDFLMDIATRGPSLGVHTILTGAASSQVRSRLQALFGGRFELRLSDPMDSGIGRKAADELPKDTPGRGLTSEEHHTHVALPRVDGVADDEDVTDGIRDLVKRVRERWPQKAVQGVRTLPSRIGLDELLRGRRSRRKELVLGMAESSLAPATTDLDRDPHLVVFGDPQTGKSTLLRGLVEQIVRRPSTELGVVMVDFRRTHLELVPEEHLLAYCTTAEQTKAVADNLAGSLKQRLPGPDVTPRQLRERSWWKGLDLYIVVDDMDMIASRSNPLAPLAPYIPQGADLGLHVIAARRTGGTARAMFEPVLQSLSDMATPGMLFSGDRMEGRLANGAASKALPQGRAQLALRGRRPDLVQVGWSEPPA